MRNDDEDEFDPEALSKSLEDAAEEQGQAPDILKAVAAHLASKQAPAPAKTMTLPGLDIYGRTPDAKARIQGAANPPNQSPPEKETTPGDTIVEPGPAAPYPALQDPRPTIQKAREEGEKGRALGLASRGLTTINAALSGQKPDYSFAKDLEAQAAVPEKRAQEDMALEQFVRNQRAAMMENDPTSPQNRALQKAIYSVLPEAKPGSFDGLTAKHLEKLDPVIANVVKARAEMELKKSTAANTQTLKEEELKRQQEHDKDTAEYHKDSIDVRRRLAEIAASKAAGKGKGNNPAKMNVDGLERDLDESGNPTTEPSAKEVSDLRKTEAVHGTMSHHFDKLTDLVKKYGSQPLPTQVQGEMSSTMASLGPLFYRAAGLNRFNPEEMKVLAGQIQDPTTVRAFLNPRFTQMMKTARENLDAEQNENRRVLGYHVKASAQPQAPAGKKGYSKAQNKTYTMSPDGKTVLKVEDGDTR